MATLYLDLEAGNDANDGTSFANRKKTLASASAIAQPGDTVRIMASTTPNSLGVNGTFAKGSPTITLASAVNATIDNGESAWTASANVTCTTSTTRKQGNTSASIAVASGFTTGLAAYKALGSTVDFSGYQQISFLFQQTVGTLSGFDIKLCSDNAGVTPVDTFSVAAPASLNVWNRVTINLGSAMGASIQSVALYVTSDNGAQTYLLDNIVACKAPGTGELTHKTLIGKANSLGAGGDDSETWYTVKSIVDTTITLDLSCGSASTLPGKYFGVSETATAYSMIPSYLHSGIITANVSWTTSGTTSQRIAISGGWNRTDMTSQTGHTWFAMFSADSVSLSFSGYYLDVQKVHSVFLASYAVTGHYLTFDDIHITGVAGSGFSITGVSNDVTGLVVSNASGSSLVKFDGLDINASLAVYSEASQLQVNQCGACNITLSADSVLQLLTATPSPLARLTFDGVTYGSLNTADLVSAIGADEGDTDISLNKLKEMLAAFMAGKVSASSAAGVTTYTYKKRNGTTTSFTSLCSEADGTRATTGSLS